MNRRRRAVRYLGFATTFLLVAFVAPALGDTVSTFDCCVPIIRALSRLNPKLIEIEFDALRPSDYFSGKIAPDRRVRAIHKSAVWNPLTAPAAKATVYSASGREKMGAAEALAAKLTTGVVYNLVILDDRIVLAATEKNVINNLLSKHLFLASGKSVHFAGTIRREADGSIVVENESGSYKPDASLLANVKAFFENGLGISELRVRSH